MDLTIPCALFFDAKEFFQFFIENANYWWVLLFMIIESSFIPFPSELVVPPAAYLAVTKGDMNLFGVIAVATVGALIGALVNYYLSMWIGRPIVYKFANSRMGHMCLINEAKVEHAEKYFDQHGAISTFLGRLIPAVRQLISIPAGLARMNFWKFLLYTTLGAGAWNSILAAIGYSLASVVPPEQLDATVAQYEMPIKYGMIVIFVGIVGFLIYKGRK